MPSLLSISAAGRHLLVLSAIKAARTLSPTNVTHLMGELLALATSYEISATSEGFRLSPNEIRLYTVGPGGIFYLSSFPDKPILVISNYPEAIIDAEWAIKVIIHYWMLKRSHIPPEVISVDIRRKGITPKIATRMWLLSKKIAFNFRIRDSLPEISMMLRNLCMVVDYDPRPSLVAAIRLQLVHDSLSGSKDVYDRYKQENQGRPHFHSLSGNFYYAHVFQWLLY